MNQKDNEILHTEQCSSGESGRDKQLLFSMFDRIKDDNIREILDAGSGGTSISMLLEYFEQAHVDAVVFPGDERKIKSVKNRVVSDRYDLRELDIVKQEITKGYDLVLAHLLLGEVTKWGNKFSDLLKRLLEINARYFVILDLKEDPEVDYNYLAEYIKDSNKFELVYQGEIEKEEPQDFGTFIGKTYIAFLVSKK
jgi:hypothetical protein